MVSGDYEITEKGITYAMQLEETRLLKNYDGSAAEWFADLDIETKKKITRTGNVPPAKNDFYPDFFPDE
ncbi:MAG TPA: hypothetical protein VIJ75_22820 [Hanamia sp.]